MSEWPSQAAPQRVCLISESYLYWSDLSLMRRGVHLLNATLSKE